MDRNLVYPGGIPLDTDLLAVNRNTMIGLGFLAQAALGTTTVVDGLACTPTTPASLTVNVAPGSITQLAVVDPSAFGSLPADPTDPLVKMGINLEPISFTLVAPTTSGQSTNYLIEATFIESDATPIVLPYYNAANPPQPFSGPNNTGVTQNTQRLQRVQLQLKAGTPANTGSQSTPPVDSGWVGLYTITVNFGQAAIAVSNILVLPGAPFLNWKRPQISPGFGAGVQAFPASGNFVVPAGVTRVEVEVWGAGSGSFASTSSVASGGGSGGGYARKRIVGLIPGQIVAVTVGVGGAAGSTTGASAGSGQTSSFGGFVSATGGLLNGSASTTNPQNGAIPGGSGIGGDANLTGSSGQIGYLSVGGLGGAAPMGGMQTSGTTGNAGIFPGGGASGAGTGSSGVTPFNGGAGAGGYVVVRW
ncbi:MAG: hypothetical protein ABI224_16265 [Acetobacteraceae bacterium]